jgi:hypothetical protein
VKIKGTGDRDRFGNSCRRMIKVSKTKDGRKFDASRKYNKTLCTDKG